MAVGIATVLYSTVGYCGSGFQRAMVAIRPYQAQGKNNPFDLGDHHETMSTKEADRYKD